MSRATDLAVRRVASSAVDAEREAGPVPGALLHHGVVVEGHLNPAIFQPAWFGAVGAISAANADQAESSVISPTVTSFRTPTLSVQVTSDRAVFRSEEVGRPAGELADVVALVFTNLSHTPLTSIDLVHEFDLPSGSIAWERVAGGLVHRDATEAMMPGAELLSLELVAEGEDGSFVQVIVESSELEEDGVYVRVHREFVLEELRHGSAGRVVGILNDNWGASLEEASTIVGRMLEQSS